MMKSYWIACLLILFTQCRKESVSSCNDQLIDKKLNFSELMMALPNDVITGSVKEPTAEGALGRNKSGYFHVRFQLDMSSLAAYAIKFQSLPALEKFVTAVEYSFRYQLAAGDFELIVPANLQSLPPATEGDKCSGVAFFTSALGSSLLMLQQSPWFNSLPSSSLVNRLALIQNKFQKTLQYLKSNRSLLEKYDQDAPNRLLFDAVAYYSMGLYLKDAEAQSIGLEFISKAIEQQDGLGFYKEGNGFDSSYNGVALRLGLSLLGMVPTSEVLHTKLQQSLSCCAQWQASRVLTSGEISTQGNTRVFPGGESFLGEEKQVAWIDTVLSFYFVYSLSGDTTYVNLAERIRSFYQ